jgi:hypothetical protein
MGDVRCNVNNPIKINPFADFTQISARRLLGVLPLILACQIVCYQCKLFCVCFPLGPAGALPRVWPAITHAANSFLEAVALVEASTKRQVHIGVVGRAVERPWV